MATPEISFANTEMAFKAKKDNELARSLWLFKLMKKPLLVKLLSKSLLLAMRLGLPVNALIKGTIFNQFCGGESIDESAAVISKLKRSHIGAILDYSIEGKESEEDFEKTKLELIKILEVAKDNTAIPYTSLKLTGIARMALLEKLGVGNDLNKEDKAEFDIFFARLDEICSAAERTNVPIYFDAEESWVQGAIDVLAEKLMEKYNKKKAIVLTTLQMYRWDRLEYLQTLIQRAREDGFFIGIKLVRGAYLEKENLYAAQRGCISQVHARKEDTDRDFDAAIDICLKNIDLITLCAGTHNEKSTMHVISKMLELGIPPEHPHVYFSQLYGMSDHISYNLANAGFNVTKYLPYGPVKSVIPYLIRRAEENTSIAGQVGRELRMLVEEKKRRGTARLLTA
jgi:proline dehydrogenase